MNRIEMLEELARLVRAWRSSTCSRTDVCVGDNHVEDCRVELARQDLLAAHDTLLLHGGRPV